MSDYEDYLNGHANLDYDETGLGEEDDEEPEYSDNKEKGKSVGTKITIDNIDCANLAGKSGIGFTNKSSKRGRSPASSVPKRVRLQSPGPSLNTSARSSMDEDELEARDQALISMVSNNLRQEMRELIVEAVGSRQPGASQQELEKLKLDQRSNAIMARGMQLSTEGAKAQFGAFAKVKANTEEARAKVLAGDAEGVISALDRIESIVDIRLEAIERADRRPGGWPAATIFERIAQSDDKNKTKLDKCWKEAVAEASEKKASETSRRSSFRGRFQRGSTRGYSSFRSVSMSVILVDFSQLLYFSFLSLCLFRLMLHAEYIPIVSYIFVLVCMKRMYCDSNIQIYMMIRKEILSAINTARIKK